MLHLRFRFDEKLLKLSINFIEFLLAAKGGHLLEELRVVDARADALPLVVGRLEADAVLLNEHFEVAVKQVVVHLQPALLLAHQRDFRSTESRVAGH